MQAFVDRFRPRHPRPRRRNPASRRWSEWSPWPTVEDRVAPFMFPAPARPINPPLVRFEKAAVGYETGKPILRNIDLRIDGDDRIALSGPTATASPHSPSCSAADSPMNGHMRHDKKLDVAYFAQHQLDELNTGETPYDHFVELMPDATEAQRRQGSAHTASARKCRRQGGNPVRWREGAVAVCARRLPWPQYSGAG